jgi:hypothetical protein
MCSFDLTKNELITPNEPLGFLQIFFEQDQLKILCPILCWLKTKSPIETMDL